MTIKLLPPLRETAFKVSNSSPFEEELSEKIIVATKKSYHFIDLYKINYLKSESNYCKIVLDDNKVILTTKTLKFYSKKLNKSSFLRVHNSYIINVSKIKKIIREGGHTIVLNSNVKIPISRSYNKHIMDLLLNIQ